MRFPGLLRLVASIVLASFLVSCADNSPSGPDPNEPPLPNLVPWSSVASWPGGHVPVAGDSVVIPAGRSILLDVSPPPLTSLTISGALVFDAVDLNLTAGWIAVPGTLRIGSHTQPYLRHAVVTLTGSPDDGNIFGMGNKVLGIMPGGTLDLHGESRNGWTRLAQTATAGATTIEVDQASGWRAGDRIVIASTDFDPMQAEDVAIAASNGTTISLASPLKFTHYGVLQTVAGRTLDERAEVGLLTRNIVVQGDTGITSGYGGHLMVLGGATARVEGIELFLMGQKSKVARYPMHWHMAGSVAGQYFTGSSVWHSFNRCVTVHGTDDATVTHNVCYDHLGHGYFLEDGAESGNTITDNLGVLTRIPVPGEEVIPSDRTPATFWITNPDNTFTANVAAGSRGFGFWIALPASPTGLSSGQPDLPRTTPLRNFSDNVAHSNRSGGLMVDNGPKADLTTEVTYFAPRQDPSAPSPDVVADFRNFIAWKHSGRAVWLRGRSLRLSNALLADNAIGATFASNETFVQNSLFLGQSANAGVGLSPGTVVRGYEFYDGRVGASGVTFMNYTGGGAVPASALGYHRQNGFPISTDNYAAGLTFINAMPVFLDTPQADRDGDKAAVFLDQDGSVTGTAGDYIVASNPILYTSACLQQPAWNAYVCPHRYVSLRIHSNLGESVAPVTIVRDDAASSALVGVPNDLATAVQSLIPSRQYSLQWSSVAPTNPRLYIDGAVAGEWLRVSFPYAHTPFIVARDYDTGHPLAAAADLAALDAGSSSGFYFDGGTGTMHVKLVVQAGRNWATVFVEPK
ncbi:MAG: G8 domain-containing protein [Gemmatimonadota bacterium]